MSLAEIGGISGGLGFSEAKSGKENQADEKAITSFIERHREDPNFPGEQWIRSAFMLTRELCGVTGYENRLAVASRYTDLLGFDDPEDLLRSLRESSYANFRQNNQR